MESRSDYQARGIERLSEMIENMVLRMVVMEANMATKEDLAQMKANMATKQDLEELKANMATKQDLEQLKANMATKQDLDKLKANMATNQDQEKLEEMVSKSLKAFGKILEEEIKHRKL